MPAGRIRPSTTPLLNAQAKRSKVTLTAEIWIAMQGFVSYAHADHRLYAGFRPHLAAIRRGFGINLWTDHEIRAGTVWDARIESAIKAAQIFVLLITPDFIASDYVYEKEIPAIQLQRRSAGALVLPVVLKRCTWQIIAAALQATPTENGRVLPVTDWHPRNNGYDRACEQMMAAIEDHFGIRRKKVDWGAP